MRIAGLMMLLLGMAGVAAASAVPEIDGGSAGSALFLLCGTIMVIKSRRRK